MKRFGWYDEKNIVIDIVGDRLIGGDILINRVREKGLMFFNNSYINSFIIELIENKVLMYDPNVNEISVDMTVNEYCLTKSCLREWKLNKLL